MNHIFKVEPQYFCRIQDGSMTFWVTENENDIQRGDSVTLREWDKNKINPTDSAQKGFTDSEPLNFEVGYVYSLGSSRVVISLMPAPKATK